MTPIQLQNLSPEDGRLIQIGLKELGFYSGTTFGIPGPNTLAAYQQYISPSRRKPLLSDHLARVASFEIGTFEQPKNSNTGPRILEYQAATSLDGTNWPWCAAFICWTFLEAQKHCPFSYLRPTTPLAWTLETWAREQHLSVLDPNKFPSIKRGDIIIFEFSHCGIALGPINVNGSILTVEGNTDSSGSREGGGVYQKTRPLSIIRSYIST